MIGWAVSLLILVMLGVVGLESASGLVILVLVNEKRTEELVVYERVLGIIEGNTPTDQSCLKEKKT